MENTHSWMENRSPEELWEPDGFKGYLASNVFLKGILMGLPWWPHSVCSLSVCVENMRCCQGDQFPQHCVRWWQLDMSGEWSFIKKGCRWKSFLPKHLHCSLTVPVTFTEEVLPQSHFSRELHAVHLSAAAGVETYLTKLRSSCRMSGIMVFFWAFWGFVC